MYMYCLERKFVPVGAYIVEIYICWHYVCMAYIWSVYKLTGLGDAVSEHAPQFLAHCICGEDLLKLNRQKLEYLQVYILKIMLIYCTIQCMVMYMPKLPQIGKISSLKKLHGIKVQRILIS